MENNVKRINNKIKLITVYRIFVTLFFIKAKAIKIGNSTKEYLGSPEKVPLEIGIKKQIKANKI